MGDRHQKPPSGEARSPGSSSTRQAATSGAATTPRDPSKLLPCAVELTLDEEEGLVQARLIPSEQAEPLDPERLEQLLAEAGYGDFHRSAETLEAVVQQANSGRAGELVLAERRDARAQWQVNGSRTAIYLTLHPARGGRPASETGLREALLRKGVREDHVLNDALARAVRDGRAQSLCVARGRPPIRGRDAELVPLVAREEDLVLREDAQGRVDLHHLHEFVTVEAGEALLRREPPTQGQAGFDVFGEELPAEPGRDQQLDSGGEGVETDPTDANLLRASRRGHPVFLRQGVRVDPVLQLKAVDVASGDVDYDGSVEIAGEVAAGYRVTATGDVCVRGLVDKADIRAGGNITVKGGVAGEEVGRKHDGDLQLRTHLSAGGSVSARFINLAQVWAGEDIVLQEYAMQSRLRAGRDLLLGEPTGKGALMGGRARAERQVSVKRLGSDAGVPTEVEAGQTNRKQRLLQSLKDALAQCEHNWQKVTETLECIERGERASPGGDRRRKLEETRDALRRRRQRIQSLIERLLQRRKSVRNAEIVVTEHQFANISLTVDGVRRYFSTEQGPTRWVRAGAELANRP